MFDMKMDVEKEKKKPHTSTAIVEKKVIEKMDVEEKKLAMYISESEDSDKTVKWMVCWFYEFCNFLSQIKLIFYFSLFIIYDFVE